MEPVVPPQRNAVLTRHGNNKLPKLPRDEAIRGYRKLGRKGWKVKVGYHRRSLAETAMFVSVPRMPYSEVRHIGR